jgi:putative phosphoesterase
MRLAVISDIHGNLLALESVLTDIKSRGADTIVNCGDLCTSPLWPRETFELLETLKLPTVRGNHDRWIAELLVEKMSPALVYTREQLSATQRAALGQLPVTHRLTDTILMCHGTPTDDYTYLLEEGHDGALLLSRPDAIAKRLEGFDTELVLCGHSHIAGMVLAPGNRLVVNPGSVGCPIFADNPTASRNNARAPHARYALLTQRSGRWNAEFISLAYDWDAAAARARANGREEWARSYVYGSVLPPNA